jgi:hypothetical protein
VYVKYTASLAPSPAAFQRPARTLTER